MTHTRVFHLPFCLYNVFIWNYLSIIYLCIYQYYLILSKYYFIEVLQPLILFAFRVFVWREYLLFTRDIHHNFYFIVWRYVIPASCSPDHVKENAWKRLEESPLRKCSSMRKLRKWSFTLSCNTVYKELLSYTGWPRKIATLTIKNVKKTRAKMKKLCALMRIEFFSQQNDTKIINFDEGVLILWPVFWGNVIFKICHSFLRSHNCRTAHFHCLAPPGKVSALALKNEDSMNKEKHSLRNFAVLQSRGSYSKKFLLTSIVTFDRKEANFENDIASEKWL